MGERIYDMNNPLALIVELRLKTNNKLIKIIRKQQRTNIRDFQKNITEVLKLLQTWKKTEMQNQRKTLDVGYVMKAIMFKTVKL